MGFETRPVLEKLEDGWWLINEPFAYDTRAGQKITVPVGFRTNLASIPWGLWNILPRDGDYAPAAIIHDFLYTTHEIAGKPISRDEADDILMEGMEALDIGFFRRWLIYSAVRVGGWWAWE